MALSKIQAESMNLADTYAFTGTVSGTPQDMVLVAETSGGGTTSQVFNGCFTATYKNYLIFASINVSSASNVGMRLQTADNSEVTSPYYNTGVYSFTNSGGEGSGAMGDFGSSNTINTFHTMNTSDIGSYQVYIFNPFLAERTHIHTKFHCQDNSGNVRTVNFGTKHDSAQSITGFRFVSNSGNINTVSTFKIYGFK